MTMIIGSSPLRPLAVSRALSASAVPAKPFRILDLPTELRLMIFECVSSK
jgi:hypothetical protein